MCVGVVDGSLVSEMAHSLTGILGAAEKHSVGSLGGAKGKLVEGDALTTGLDDAGSVGWVFTVERKQRINEAQSIQ